MDADDALAPDALQKLLPVLGGGKDLYYLPWLPRSGKSYGAFTPKTFEELCRVNVAAWNKCCRRELYVQFPDYHPEDVAAHFELLDKVETFGAAEDVMYEYDDRNPAAYSRTYDWLKARPCNILALAEGDVLNKAGLRDEAVSGCLRTAADLYDLAHRAKKPEVRAAVLRRLRSTWRNIAAGYYIH